MSDPDLEIVGEGGKRYPSPGACIYCGDASQKLCDEHIVPFSISGDMVIFERASCKPCADFINKEFETHVTRQMLLPFRVRAGSPTRDPRRRPKELPIVFVPLGENRRPNGPRMQVNMPAENIPLSLMSWRLPPPGLHRGAPPSEEIVGEAWSHYNEEEFKACEDGFRQATGYDGPLAMKVGDMNPRKFLRFIAKTAHAYAVAERGMDAFEPMLLDLIFGRSQAVCHLVGGDWQLPDPSENPTTAELYIGDLSLPEGEFTSVKFQLFPLYGSPIHIIIAGKTKGTQDQLAVG